MNYMTSVDSKDIFAFEESQLVWKLLKYKTGKAQNYQKTAQPTVTLPMSHLKITGIPRQKLIWPHRSTH